ncbi:MAG: biopolymer transporter ExbD, partial [Planctomycetota bacterium]|nr:biopolymer transporter ExbD [Planctomycetota bacterium]
MTEKVDIQMTPMIDCVFQLLIFFMLTLKIIEPEGDFSVNMPRSSSGPPQENILPEIKVRLVANADGTLGQVRLGQQNLGNDEAAFDRLNSRILQIIGRPGNPLTKDMEVEL